MNNVVQVKFLGHAYDKRYTFNVPEGITLHKGDLVIVKNRNQKIGYVVCVTDSEMLSDNAIDMIMEGRKVISDVVGRLVPQFFEFVEEPSDVKNEEELVSTF